MPRGDGVEITGTVEGAPGEVVAGWARVGATKHWHANVVRVQTATGLVAIELDAAELGPVATRTAPWRELEADAAARLCVADAPAPHVETTLHAMLLRGGDAVVALGEATGTALVEQAGDAFRAGASSRVTALRASALAVGPDAAALVRTYNARTSAHHDPMRRWHRRERLVLAASLAGAVLAGGAAAVMSMPMFGIGLAAVALIAPFVFGELLSPPFAELGSRTRRTRGSASAVICGGILLQTLLMIVLGAVIPPLRPHQLGPVFPLVSAVEVVLAGCVWLEGRMRRRRLASLADAQLHATPIANAVWGALDGIVSTDQPAPTVGEREVIAIAAPFGIVASGIRIGGVPVQLDGALLMSFDEVSHTATIGPGASARVVGRAVDGVLVKGGPESLLVFAVPAGGSALDELQRVRRRIVQNALLALLGGMAFVGAVALHFAMR